MQSAPSANPLTPLTPDLWILCSAMESLNSGIWLRGDTACLINPGVFPNEIAAIRAFLDERHIAPQYMILTHFHVGYLNGARAFPGALLIAHAKFAVEAERQSAAIQKIMTEQQWGAADDLLPVPQPAIPITEGSSLYVDDMLVQLLAAPGKAPDQLLLYQPDGGTLWCGGLLHESEVPHAAHGYDAYEKTLELLAEHQPGTLIPAHGQPVTDPDEIQGRLTRDRAYLAAVRTTISGALAENLSFEETAKRCAEFSAPYSNSQDTHRINVKNAYRRLGGKVEPSGITRIPG
jgi:glyoxylase-like metal-dependent hydrolase (beta-lactamase superfamily II)